MKDLNKRILRELKAHLGRYLALFLMIALGMYLVVSIAGMAETTIKGTDDYNSECHLQDGQFTVFSPITDDRLKNLSREYGEIEGIFSVDVSFEMGGAEDKQEKVLRVFKKRTALNLVRPDEGRNPEADDEIVIMNLFADRNELEPGSEIVLAGKTYTVSEM